jgi:hypothetical protein
VEAVEASREPLLEIGVPRAHRRRTLVKKGPQRQDHRLDENHLRGLD